MTRYILYIIPTHTQTYIYSVISPFSASIYLLVNRRVRAPKSIDSTTTTVYYDERVVITHTYLHRVVDFYEALFHGRERDVVERNERGDCFFFFFFEWWKNAAGSSRRIVVIIFNEKMGVRR